jgi:hypothetical protein
MTTKLDEVIILCGGGNVMMANGECSKGVS